MKLKREEIYQLTEKLMVLEESTAAEWQAKLDKVFDINARRVNDMQRLKQYIERLRTDMQILHYNRRQARVDGDSIEGDQEASNDSDRMVNEQIASTLEYISKIIEANVE